MIEPHRRRRGNRHTNSPGFMTDPAGGRSWGYPISAARARVFNKFCCKAGMPAPASARKIRRPGCTSVEEERVDQNERDHHGGKTDGEPRVDVVASHALTRLCGGFGDVRG